VLWDLGERLEKRNLVSLGAEKGSFQAKMVLTVAVKLM
jgi:hypothetical protein